MAREGEIAEGDRPSVPNERTAMRQEVPRGAPERSREPAPE